MSAEGAPARRFDPMSGNWTMIALDVIWVVVVNVTAYDLAAWAFPDATMLAFALLSAVLMFTVVALPLRYFLIDQRKVASRREKVIQVESRRREFESRLGRALDMTDEIGSALDVSMRAVRVADPESHTEVLLADSSRSHLTRVAHTAGHLAEATCDVATPGGCPAVKSGSILRFADSTEFDACPYLRDRGGETLGAACVPISVMGNSVGVLHTVRVGVHRFGDSDVNLLSTVAQQLGSRIGMLRAMSQSQLQANTDPLTGLLNRRSLENEVRILVQDAQPFAVILADLDHFKLLNDTHGHDVGDRALRVFSKVLKRSVRDGDLVSRYGGEEFLLVMPNVDKHGASMVFDRVRLELEATFGDGRVPGFTVSAGIADTEEASAFDELVNVADSRLLAAKKAGRNRSVVSVD
ncbi:MAG TPA: sensor domain-containing diguanylate cyclase [Ilumatobacteraceae bacterium]|nr:sensor domain-containing diguanylate cyclase [Ilumatobacteraceae bacterium]